MKVNVPKPGIVTPYSTNKLQIKKKQFFFSLLLIVSYRIQYTRILHPKFSQHLLNRKVNLIDWIYLHHTLREIFSQRSGIYQWQNPFTSHVCNVNKDMSFFFSLYVILFRRVFFKWFSYLSSSLDEICNIFQE